MKLDIRLETWGDDMTRPILFFVDDVNPQNKTIECYSPRDGHAEASRAYMRKCRKPETPADFAKCWQFLESYAFTAKHRA